MGLLKPWDGGGFDGSCLPGMTTSVSSLEPARDEAERQLVLKQLFCVVVFQGWFGWSMAKGYDGLHEECSAMPGARSASWKERHATSAARERCGPYCLLLSSARMACLTDGWDLEAHLCGGHEKKRAATASLRDNEVKVEGNRRARQHLAWARTP